MRIVVIPMRESPTTTVFVLVEAGSKYETKEINGISHFLEHMAFKGTKKRSYKDISRDFDSLGSLSNAFTWYEYTGYYAKSRNKNFDKITEIISDIYLNSELPEKEIEKERGVIKAEIDMYEDMPDTKVHILLDELMYGNQPAGWKIVGTKNNVEKINRDDFLKYKSKNYVAKKTVVVVAGNINPKYTFEKIEKYFSKIKTKKGANKKKTIEKQNKPQILVKNKKTEQTHICFGFRSINNKSKKLPAIKLLSTILGKGMSSRLFERLRDEMGVAYYVSSLDFSQSDIGNFRIFAGVDPKRLKEVIRAIIEEIRKIKKEYVLDKELEKAKEYLTGNTQMSLESSDSIAEWYGSKEITHLELKTPEEEASEIKKISAKDIKNIANEIFKNNKTNLAIIGPHKDDKDLLKLINL